MRKAISLFLSVIMLVNLVPAVSLPLAATGSGTFAYVDAAGNLQTPQTCQVLDGTETVLNTGWYAVKDYVMYSDRITVDGDVNIIICDGAFLMPEKGITVDKGSSLTIWSQCQDLTEEGAMLCGRYCENGAGIGTLNSMRECGTVTFNGSVSEVYGSTSRPVGIGDCSGDATSGNLIVNNGYIEVMPYYTGEDCKGTGICVSEMVVNGGFIMGHSMKGDSGIKIGNDFIVNGGGAHSNKYGIEVGGTLYINSGRLSASLEESGSIYAANGILVGNEMDILLPTGACLNEAGTRIVNANGTDIKGEILITPKPFFNGHSMSITGEVGVNFLLSLPKDDITYFADSYMEFKISGVTVSTMTIDQAVREDSGKWRFTCFVSSIQMADEITPVFHYGGGKTITGEGYSVTDYISFIRANRSADDPVYEIVTAMADYGHYAQVRLSGLRGWTIDVDYKKISKYTTYSSSAPADVLAEISTNQSNEFKRDFDSNVIERITYSMDFQSKPLIYLYIQPKGAGIDEFSASDGSEPLTWELRSDGRYRIKVEAGLIQCMNELHTVTVKSGNQQIAEIKVSGLSYVKSALEYASDHSGDPGNDSTVVNNFMVSFYRFHSLAKAYVGN